MADLCLDEFTDHGHCGVLDARRRGRQRRDPRALRRDGAGAGRRRRRRRRHQRDDGRPGRRGARRARRGGRAATSPSSPTPRSTPRRSTARSARPSTRQLTATAAPTSRTRPTAARRCARCASTSPRAPTSSWSSRRGRYLDVLREVADCRRRPGRGLPGVRRVRDGRGRRRARLDRPRPRDPRVADRRIRRAGADIVLTYWAAEVAALARARARGMTAYDDVAPASQALFARGQRRDPRRRELAGARVPRRRRHAALHGARPRPVRHRRRRPRVRRPRRLVGADDPRPRAPDGRRGRARAPRRAASPSAPRAPARSLLAEEIVAPGRRRSSRCGSCQQRHRGDDDGDPAGARVHRPHRRS